MNSLLENGLITEMDCGNNFAYLLKDNSLFLSTEYKVLQSQKEGCFIKCMKLLYNGKVQFYYLVNHYKPLSQMITSLDSDSFITIVYNILGNVINVKNNGFLSCQNVDISFDHIYVDVNTYKVKLVYLPVNCHFFQDELSFENELRSGFVKLISEMPELSTIHTAQLSSALANGTLSLQNLYSQIKGGLKNTGNISSAIDNKEKARKSQLKIIAMNDSENVVFQITKESFVIGKNAAVVDGVISFNKMISRVHCKILKNDGRYYIEDLQSSNGTYINRARLQPNQTYPIKDGDIIRLANSDFRVIVD